MSKFLFKSLNNVILKIILRICKLIILILSLKNDLNLENLCPDKIVIKMTLINATFYFTTAEFLSFIKKK